MRFLKACNAPNLVDRVAEEFADTIRSTAKFIGFLLAHLPSLRAGGPALGTALLEGFRFEKGFWLGLQVPIEGPARRGAFSGANVWPGMAIPDSDVPSETPTGLAASMMGGVWQAKDTPMLCTSSSTSVGTPSYRGGGRWAPRLPKAIETGALRFRHRARRRLAASRPCCSCCRCRTRSAGDAHGPDARGISAGEPHAPIIVAPVAGSRRPNIPRIALRRSSRFMYDVGSRISVMKPTRRALRSRGRPPSVTGHPIIPTRGH